MGKRLGLSTILAFYGAAFSSDYTSWGKTRVLTVSTAARTSTAVTKIPVLVRFTVGAQADMFTGGSAALANGADLRVTKSNGTTDLPFEVDNWTTGASGSGAIWVLLDSLPANSASAYTFRVYYGKAGQTTMSSPATVFAPSNGFMAVYHFNEVSGTNALDASGNNNSAVPGAGAPTDLAGSIIGVGKTFDGTSQSYQVGTDSTALNLNSDVGPWTLTAWVNPNSCPTNRMTVISKYANDNTAGTRQYAMQTGPTTGNWRVTDNPTVLGTPGVTTGGTNNEFVADAAGACTNGIGVWSMLAGTYNASGVVPTTDGAGAGNLSMYVNGALSGTGVTANQANGASVGRAASVFIGRLNSTASAAQSRWFGGNLDELTVSNVQRSADWLMMGYETQRSDQSAVTIAVSGPAGIVTGGALLPGLKVVTSASSIAFQLPQGILGARISVLNAAGREVWSRNGGAGVREMSWKGLSASGSRAAPGVYMVRLTIEDASHSSTLAAENKFVLAP